MNLRFDQQATHLQQKLLPIYLISGDEPLQLTEATDAVRAAARAKGYSERQVFHAEAGFDWNELQTASATMSLFAEQRIIELRIPSGKPGDAVAVKHDLSSCFITFQDLRPVPQGLYV